MLVSIVLFCAIIAVVESAGPCDSCGPWITIRSTCPGNVPGEYQWRNAYNCGRTCDWYRCFSNQLQSDNGDCDLKESTFYPNHVVEWGPLAKFRVDVGSVVNSLKEGENLYSTIAAKGAQVKLSDETYRECDGSWNWISKMDTKERYHLETSPKHPLDAISYCQSLSGTLTSVENIEHNNLLAIFMGYARVEYALIGYTDKDSEGTWRWMDGSNSHFTYWYSGEPNNVGAGEDYILMACKYDGQWFDMGPPKKKNHLLKRGKTLNIPFWCKISPGTATTAIVRLRATRGSALNSKTGLLEVFTQGKWGTVCQDKFDDKAATVVCRMLGNNLGGTRISANFFGTGAILLDDLTCDGDEDSIFDCNYRQIGRHDCRHSQDVWVSCFDKCPPGRYLSRNNLCELCAPGTYQRNHDEKSCLMCPAGWFQPSYGSRSCSRCPRGSYSGLSGSRNCAQCPAGSMQPITGSRLCKACEKGFYQDTKGSSSCKKCGTGTTTAGSGADSKSSCQSQQITPECGKRRVGGKARITLGQDANYGEFPWQILIRSNSRRVEFCGGTLIDHDTVVTAGHCTHLPPISRCTQSGRESTVVCDWLDQKDLSIILGVTNKDKQKGVIIDVKAIYVIDTYDYNNGVIGDDLAIMKLERPVEFSSTIQPACLPDKNLHLIPNQPLIITGFGHTESGGHLQNIMQKAFVLYVPRETCNEYMDDRIAINMMCAGFSKGGVDACQGDSGGPIGLNSDKFTLVGVISWGDECGREGKYGVYTMMSKMLGFVEAVQNKELEPISKPAPEPAPEPASCGKRIIEAKGRHKRIVGGTKAYVGEFPWQVSIRHKSLQRDICGGTLIDHDTVVTAGLCTHFAKQSRCTKTGRGSTETCDWLDQKDLSIVLGVTDKDKENGVIIDVKAIYVPDTYQYKSGVIDDDLAIMKLERPVDFSDTIQPACLPDSNFKLTPDQLLVITGFGDTEFGGQVTTVMHKAHVPYVPRETCNTFMDDRVSINMMCAGFSKGGVDACHGDSGGPIGIYSDKFTLVGVISWGEKCAEKGKYGVYTSMSKMLGFVEAVQNKELEPISYFRTGSRPAPDRLHTDSTTAPHRLHTSSTSASQWFYTSSTPTLHQI